MTEAIFFDDGLGLLAPLTDLRASFDIRTGALTNRERICRVFGLESASLIVPPRLEGLAVKRGPDVRGTRSEGAEEPVLHVNGRCALPHEEIVGLEPGQGAVEAGTGHLVAAVLLPSEFDAWSKGDSASVASVVELPAPALLSRPWHAISFRDRCIEIDLDLLAGTPTRELPPAVLGIGDAPLTIGVSAVIYPGVTLDLEHGPIVIAEHAVIRPGATIIGPVYVGPHSTVLERALIKPNTAIGPWCKVSGEVSGTIFQGYSNKGHEGFLGDSHIGEWVNLGAGTNNSNLLNTYSEVIAKAPGGGNERTGLTFLGAIIGDHVKTAIGSRIMTGSILQTGGMFAQSAAVSGTTPRFAWSTDAGLKSFRIDKFMETARAMMARRGQKPTAAYEGAVMSLGSRSEGW